MNATTIDRLHVVERTHFSLSRFIFGKLIGVQSLKGTSMFFLTTMRLVTRYLHLF